MNRNVGYLLFLYFLLFCKITIASPKYDHDLLERQFKYYSPAVAMKAIQDKDYIKAAINALSIYPLSPNDSIYIALQLEDKIKEPLPDFLFKAYREMGLSGDTSLKIEKEGKASVVGEWAEQKAKWCDDFINEIRCYIRIRQFFGNNIEKTDKFFVAFHQYYLLEWKEAFSFLDKININSAGYKILDIYGNAAASKQPADINNLNKIDLPRLSNALKEMVIILKGDYYLAKNDFAQAKKAYLEYLDEDFSTPTHVENLAMCYMAEKNYASAKKYYLSLTKKMEMDNITAGGIYNLACIWAMEGDKDKAIDYLREAIKYGMPKADARNDKDLASLRNDKRFIELTKDSSAADDVKSKSDPNTNMVKPK